MQPSAADALGKRTNVNEPLGIDYHVASCPYEKT